MAAKYFKSEFAPRVVEILGQLSKVQKDKKTSAEYGMLKKDYFISDDAKKAFDEYLDKNEDISSIVNDVNIFSGYEPKIDLKPTTSQSREDELERKLTETMMRAFQSMSGQPRIGTIDENKTDGKFDVTGKTNVDWKVITGKQTTISGKKLREHYQLENGWTDNVWKNYNEIFVGIMQYCSISFQKIREEIRAGKRKADTYQITTANIDGLPRIQDKVVDLTIVAEIGKDTNVDNTEEFTLTMTRYTAMIVYSIEEYLRTKNTILLNAAGLNFNDSKDQKAVCNDDPITMVLYYKGASAGYDWTGADKERIGNINASLLFTAHFCSTFVGLIKKNARTRTSTAIQTSIKVFSSTCKLSRIPNCAPVDDSKVLTMKRILTVSSDPNISKAASILAAELRKDDKYIATRLESIEESQA